MSETPFTMQCRPDTLDESLAAAAERAKASNAEVHVLEWFRDETRRLHRVSPDGSVLTDDE